METKIIVTNIPAFYKINMYNEINKKVNLYVIFTDAIESDRNGDFVNGKIKFKYTILTGTSFQKISQAINIVKHFDYSELILGGWDHPVLWALVFRFPKKKNAFFIESSYFESATNGLKGLIKRLFVSRLFKVYASGKSQRRITDELGFKGKIVLTKGVGVFNYIPQPNYIPRSEVKNFFYVGRFVEVNNLKFLISVFNGLLQYNLYLAGFGEQEEELKAMAKENIHFMGAIENKKLTAIYQQMDVFVLPSKIEPWGLVVEEALNNGLPVIVSNRVGCAEEIINESNGLIFQYNNPEDLTRVILKMSDIAFYNNLRKNISLMDFEKTEKKQIECYI